MDLSTSSHHQNTTANASPDPELSPLEQEVLDEYAKLAGNLDNVTSPSPLHHPQLTVRETVIRPPS